MPMLGHVAENGLVSGVEFREDNEALASRTLEFTKACAAQMPKGNRIAHMRGDSAAYQAELFNGCAEQRVTFVIGGVQDAAAQAAIAATLPRSGSPIGTDTSPIPCSALPRPRTPFVSSCYVAPLQQDLFTTEAPSLCYTLIDTNREGTPEEIVRW